MAYSELIKSFGRIRAYMRSFYVYGFKHRGEFDEKSARAYDNERRRIESWLGDYMSFGRDEDGRRVFLSVDSRAAASNPLYRAFRTKSFTDRDIMLHFHLLDILENTEGLSITEITEELAERLNEFDSDEIPDESTIRKKLQEYVEQYGFENAEALENQYGNRYLKQIMMNEEVIEFLEENAKGVEPKNTPETAETAESGSQAETSAESETQAK